MRRVDLLEERDIDRRMVVIYARRLLVEVLVAKRTQPRTRLSREIEEAVSELQRMLKKERRRRGEKADEDRRACADCERHGCDEKCGGCHAA